MRKKAALTACSNGLSTSQEENVEKLVKLFNNVSLETVKSEYLYYRKDFSERKGSLRAKEFMKFWSDENISDIFDISGGDLANEVIPYLDFDLIGRSEKTFWGYSDLTVIINAIYSKTGKKSVLFQVRNLIDSDEEKTAILGQAVNEKRGKLFDFPYEFIQGDEMSGVTVGGNVRCFLKLAGTDCFPDLNGKLLLLESLGGGREKMVTYLSQLKMIGAFDAVSGVILGTFTEFEKTEGTTAMTDLVKDYIPDRVPVIKTQFIGHGKDSYAIKIGERYVFKRYL